MPTKRSQLISAASLTALMMSGCGNLIDDDDLVTAGDAGVMRGEDGAPVIVFSICQDGVDTVQVVEDREGLEETQENVVAATYRSTSPLPRGMTTFDLADPGSSWSPSTPFVLEPGQGYLISAQSQERETWDVYVDAEGVADLAPNTIYRVAANGDQESVTEKEFVAAAERGCEQ